MRKPREQYRHFIGLQMLADQEMREEGEVTIHEKYAIKALNKMEEKGLDTRETENLYLTLRQEGDDDKWHTQAQS